ncbi:MAG TPA: Gfo/Idh/MocA family oxidoreductase [Bryobacteraceae bacterium]|nr:Gfo/Idh/MocA family oxidoreductase [Bryobacteraceae bacterium]
MNLSRRTFCATAAAIGKAASGDKIRVAMIGTGHGHAASKVQALRMLPEYDFVGICRPDADEPNEGEAFRGVRWMPMAEVLGDASIELVAVESFPGRNLAYAQKCVRAGKFVHLDKPPGADLPALRAMLSEAGERRRVVQMGYQWRYHPGMQAAMEAARNGWLGQVHRMRLSIDKPIGAEERQQLARFRGGVMFSEGCHLVDRATALFGKPAKVAGFLRHDSKLRDGLADNTLALLEYEQAMAEISVAAFQPNGGQYRRLEIAGSNGVALVQPFAPLRLMVDLKEAAGPYKSGGQTLQPAAPPGPAYAPDFQEMARIIRKGEMPSYSPQHDLITQETLLLACNMLG